MDKQIKTQQNNFLIKSIKNFPMYSIDTNGQVYSYYNGKYGVRIVPRKKKGILNSNNYIKIQLRNGGKIYTKAVHRLVLETFVGKSPKDMECRHLNGIRNDNRLENLKWGTKKENEEDKKIHGSVIKGESSPSSKLTNKKIIFIRQRKKEGETLMSLAKMFNVCESSISRIVNRITWKHI